MLYRNIFAVCFCLFLITFNSSHGLAQYTPTNMEQLFIERLNEIRSNPANYGNSIGLDLSNVQPVQPLALDPRLVQSARLHSQDMNNRNFFSHVNPSGIGAGTRINAAGFSPAFTYGESCAGGTFMDNADHALRALIIDAGIPDLGHRKHLLGMDGARNERYIGVGVHANGTGTYRNYTTINTGSLYDNSPVITGVIYRDTNNNTRYDLDDGLGGINIHVPGVGSTATFPSGGYSIRVPANRSYRVIASGPGLEIPVTKIISVGSNNVRVNITSNSAIRIHNEYLIKHLYLDLLQRAAHPNEVVHWINWQSQGNSRDEMVNIIMNSVEAKGFLVRQMYLNYLGRTADPGGYNYFTNLLASGTSEDQVKATILNSPEYFARRGNTNHGFIYGGYLDLLIRAPQSHEHNYWTNVANVHGRHATAQALLNSMEAKQAQLRDYYTRFLRRSIDHGGLTFFSNGIAAGVTLAEIKKSLLCSEEYFRFAANNPR